MMDIDIENVRKHLDPLDEMDVDVSIDREKEELNVIGEKESGKTVQKIVLKVEMDEKMIRKAMKIVTQIDGVYSISISREKKELTVIGVHVDAVKLVTKLEKLCPTVLLSIGPAKERVLKEEDGKKVEIMKSEHGIISQIQPKSIPQNQASLDMKIEENKPADFMKKLLKHIMSPFAGIGRIDNSGSSSTHLFKSKSTSEPVSLNINLPESSRPNELLTRNDPESPRHAPEVFINPLSAAIHDIQEISLDFDDSHGTGFEMTEFLGLVEKELEYKMPKSKIVAVMNVKVIHIRNSVLPEVPFILNFPNLEMLFLHSNLDLSNIISIFEQMPALKVLDISNTSIGILPPWIYKFTKLEVLIVQHCELLIELTHEISALRNLKLFDLSGCTNLAKIPESIDMPQSLCSLNLTDCKSLTKLPESICKLILLQNMNLSGCTNLVVIPESIELLEGLSSLDLTDCKSLRKLPEGISNMRSLNCLNLSGCSRLFELQTGWNDPESKFLAPEVSINKLSTARKADTMEVQLNFHQTDGTLFDITELFCLLKMVLGYKLLKSKFVEVMNLKVIHLRNSRLSQIPDNLSFPDLEMLVLQPNIDFCYIPSSFLELMPALKVVDMSHTNIKSLPYWIYQLTKLEELILRHCELLIELPNEVGALGNLKVLDLEGTNLVCLPEELKELIALKCLKFSLYDAESYRKSKDIVAIIPRKTLSKLTHLEELSINVDPQEEWCGAAMEAVLGDLPSLRKLKTLKLYLPTSELLQDLLELKGKNDLPIYQNLSDFKLIIGPHAQHFISRLPCELEEEFLKLKKCLKYINGEDSTPKLVEAVRHTNALYLDRHWTLQKLSVFKFEVLTKLKFCLLVDCNEMQTLFDGSDFNFGIVNNEDKFLSMQYLAIHYLRKLEVIWKGPGVGCCLHSLKVLVVHTCPNLTTIFTPVLLVDLVNLREIEVEDCQKIKTLVAKDQSRLTSKEILPRLRKISLLYLPELVSMFDDFSIGPELESVVIYDCPKLERLPSMGVCNKEVIEVKGESEWWNALEWSESSWSDGQPYRLRPFSESDTDEDMQDELAPRYGNTLRFLVEDCNSS
ncbi:hypothetical protein AgCh_022733 [Apium graveolens]